MSSKYRARKTLLCGILFDSKAEAQYWLLLRNLEEKGLISRLQCQVPYELVPSQKVVGADGRTRTWRKAAYVADFQYFDADGRLHVVDVKGVRTPLYRLKKKLMLEKYGVEIEEVQV